MRTIDANTRTAFLSGDCTPVSIVTVRQERLGFSAPLVLSSYDVIESSKYASDDFYDLDGVGGPYIWGDSCVTALSSYFVRLINAAAWGDSSDYFLSSTDTPETAANWEYVDITNTSALNTYTRLGVYPKAGSDDVRVWWADTAGDVYISDLDFTPSVSWSLVSSGFEADDGDGWSGLAIHPVSETAAIVVGYTSPYIWVRYCIYGSDWLSSGDRHVVWMTDEIAFNDVHFSDAVHIGGTEYVIMLSLSRDGSSYAIKYDSASDVYSQPVLAAGGAADLTGYTVRTTGMSYYNSRIWAVTERELIASDDEPQAYHQSFLSSSDGIHWRDDDFIGVHACRGKLLYDSGEDDCYIAGNAVVYDGEATIKLGTDVAAMKLEIGSSSTNLTCTRDGAPHELSVSMVDEGATVHDDALVDVGNTMTFELKESGETESEIIKTYIVKKSHNKSYKKERTKILGRGIISSLAGKDSYRPPAGRPYDSPNPYYTNFTKEKTGAQLLTVRQVSGKHTAEMQEDTGNYALKSIGGISLVPRSIGTQWLTLSTHFKPVVSVDGQYIVLYYEDASNYWRVGVARDAGSATTKLVLERVVSGIATEKDSDSVAISPGDELSLYVDARPGTIRAYLNTTYSDDFSSADASVSYDTTAESSGMALPHHIGFESSPWLDYDAANKTGTLTEDSDGLSIVDSAQTFVDGDVADWCRVGEKWRQVFEKVSATKIAFKVQWADPPRDGDEYGLYDEESAPYMLVRDIAFCDGSRAWTIDDIVTDILEVAGATRASVFTGAVNPIASATVGYNIDVRTTDAAPGIFIHTSEQSTFSGWYVFSDANWTTLQRYDAGAATTQAKFPNLIAPGTIASTEFRYIHKDRTIYVYAGDHFLCSFWDIRTSQSGYIGVPAGNTGTTTEFPSLKESFIWDENKTPMSAIAGLLRGRPARLIEKQDGELAVSKFEDHDDLGAWSTTVRQTKDSTAPAPSLIEVEGGDVRQYHIEESQSRKRIRFKRVKNESVEGPLQVLADAVRVARLATEEANPYGAELHVPDPKAEIEDMIEIDGTDYVVTGYSMRIGHTLSEFKWGASYSLREKAVIPTGAVLGTDTYGESYWG